MVRRHPDRPGRCPCRLDQPGSQLRRHVASASGTRPFQDVDEPADTCPDIATTVLGAALAGAGRRLGEAEQVKGNIRQLAEATGRQTRPGARLPAMAVVRLSDVGGKADIGHQLKATCASLPRWAQNQLDRIGIDLLRDPEGYGADCHYGPLRATLTTLLLTNETAADDELLVCVFLASATATGRKTAKRRRLPTRGAQALPGTYSETVLNDGDGRPRKRARNVLLAEDEQATSNWFTEALAGLLEHHEPVRLYLSTARVIRSLSFISSVADCLQYADVIIEPSGREWDPTDRNSQAMLFMTGLFAAFDRDGIVQRQAGGKLSRSQEGRLIVTHHALPPGYATSTSGQPEVDSAAAPLVAVIVHALGMQSKDVLDDVLRSCQVVSPRMSPFGRWTWNHGATLQMAATLGLHIPPAPEPAVTTAPTQKLLADAHSLDVARVTRWLDVWAGGPYEFEQRMPLGTRVDVNDIPHWQEADGRTIALLSVRMPQPEDGWADRTALQQARLGVDRWLQRAGERGSIITAARGKGTMPLLGPVSTYRDDLYEYRLMSGRTIVQGNKTRTYQLRRQPLPADGAKLTWRDDENGNRGEAVGTVWEPELHRVVADLALQAIRAAVVDRADTDIDYGPLRPHVSRRRMDPADDIALLQQDIAQAEQAREAAYQLLRLPAHDPQERARRVNDELNRIDAQLERLNNKLQAKNAIAPARTEQTDDQPVLLTTELDLLTQVLHGLRNSGLCNAQTKQAFADVLQVRLTRTSPNWMSVLVEVAVLREGLQVGRVHATGRVMCRGDAPVPADRLPRPALPLPLPGECAPVTATAARAAHDTVAIMRDGSDLVSLLSLPDARLHARSKYGRAARLAAVAYLTRLAADHDHPIGERVAAVMLRIPYPEVRLILWHALHNDSIPAGADPQFAAHIAATYLGPAAAARWAAPGLPATKPKTTSVWAHNNPAYLAVFDVLAARESHNASRTELHAVLRAAGGRAHTLTNLLAGTERHPAPLRRHACSHTCPRPCAARTWVGLHPCPHQDCPGSLDTLARIFEVTSGILCSTCMRMPHPHSPTFPTSYLTGARSHAHDLIRYAPDVLGQRGEHDADVPHEWWKTLEDVIRRHNDPNVEAPHTQAA